MPKKVRRESNIGCAMLRDLVKMVVYFAENRIEFFFGEGYFTVRDFNYRPRLMNTYPDKIVKRFTKATGRKLIVKDVY
jgi:hypothetical protein